MLVIDRTENTVQKAIVADPLVLSRLLTDMGNLRTWDIGQEIEGDKLSPDSWGRLVISRSETGEVIDMDPEIAEAFAASTAVSTSKGIGANMLKVSANRYIIMALNSLEIMMFDHFYFRLVLSADEHQKLLRLRKKKQISRRLPSRRS